MGNPDTVVEAIHFTTVGDPSAGISPEYISMLGFSLEYEDAEQLGELLREELADFFDAHVNVFYHNSEGNEIGGDAHPVEHRTVNPAP